MSKADILITGATGRTGGATIDELLNMGKSVRAYVRAENENTQALRKKGVEIAFGDFTDLNAIRAAMEGIKSAYFLYPIAPGILSATAYFAQAAKEAGVTALVNLSQKSARRDATSHAAQDHWVSERVFDWSDVPVTHLRPTFFADWFIYPWFAREIWARKKIEFPFGQGRHAPIATEDQGRVIATILAKPYGHGGKTYSLHGPIEMDLADIAQVMSEVLGTKIEYAPTSIEDFKEKMENIYKFPPFLVQHLVEVAKDYQGGTIFNGTNDNVEVISGVAPLLMPAFFNTYRACYSDPTQPVSLPENQHV
ncbi:NmrA family NAD(P)-binding protein [Martelella alba]|uniref:NAD-dependent epimerase/dehydratase family protein n=1 Tax=Martelella alba TaxID=2590451 RepID=A0ABY2STL0_9HYPH|nr:NmrA family NAD(P)-binding protein [Martelella alba]TKI08868.1 NAD-dependent epimerase/dehydratase family protein [Martelella alba]